MKTAIGLISIFITLPIWFWLIYQILVRVDASELMWFLYWVYVPASLLMHVLVKMFSQEATK